MQLRKYFTFDAIMNWPFYAKISALAVIFFIIVFVAYYVDIQSGLSRLVSLQKQESDLKKQYSVNYKRWLYLQAYKKQAAKLNETYKKLSLQLPKEVEMSALLRSISGIGQDSGLHFKLFDPLRPKQQNRYVILPINMIVLGNYHQLANFINRLSRLDRLITFENFVIKDTVVKNKQEDLVTDRGLHMSLLIFIYYQNAQAAKEGVV